MHEQGDIAIIMFPVNVYKSSYNNNYNYSALLRFISIFSIGLFLTPLRHPLLFIISIYKN